MDYLDDTEETPGAGTGDDEGTPKEGASDEGGSGDEPKGDDPKGDEDPLVDENLVDMLFEEYGLKDEEGDEGGSSEDEGAAKAKEEAGGAASDDEPKGSDDADGSAAPKAEGVKVDLNDPEVRTAFTDWYRTLQASEEQSAAARDKVEKVEKLVEAGDTEALGAMFVEEWTGAKATRGMAQAAQRQMLTETYRELYANPALQGLSQEEIAEINPKTFNGNDAQYIQFLHGFIARKETGTLTDEQIEERVKERIKAKANETRGKKVSGASASDLPGAQSGTPSGDDSKSAGDLLSEGFADMVSGGVA